MECCRLRVGTAGAVYQRGHPEIDIGEMWVGAEIVPNNDGPIGLEIGERPLHLIFAYMESAQSRGHFSHEARLF